MLNLSLQRLLHLLHRFEEGVVVEVVAGVGVRKEGDELHVLDFLEQGGDVDLVQVKAVDDSLLRHPLDGDLVPFLVGDDAAFVEERRARLKLRFDQEHALPALREERREAGDDVTEGDERHVRDNEVVPAPADLLRGELPEVAVLDRLHLRDALQRRVQLLRAHIHRGDERRPVLQGAVGEAAGGTAHVEDGFARKVEAEVNNGLLQFEAAAAHVLVEDVDDLDGGVLRRLLRGLVDNFPVHRDGFLDNGVLRPLARGEEAAGDQKFV